MSEIEPAVCLESVFIFHCYKRKYYLISKKFHANLYDCFRTLIGIIKLRYVA